MKQNNSTCCVNQSDDNINAYEGPDSREVLVFAQKQLNVASCLLEFNNNNKLVTATNRRRRATDEGQTIGYESYPR